jgi:hypothetical protein
MVAIIGKFAHVAAKATKAAAPEAAEAATAAPRRIAGTPTHGYAATREAAMAAFAKGERSRPWQSRRPNLAHRTE